MNKWDEGKVPPARSCRRYRTVVEGVSMTKQSEAQACDVNHIMRRYEKLGLTPAVLSRMNMSVANFADVSAGVSYQDSMVRLVEAQESFMALPAAVRKRFGNDPGEFLEFAVDPRNVEEMRSLGLLPKPQEEPVVKVSVQDPKPAGGTPAGSGLTPGQGAVTKS